MMVLVLPWATLLLAGLPAAMILVNARQFRRLPSCPPNPDHQQVSVLIPARNEQAHIVEAVRSVLANRQVDLEIIVLDDGSTDDTPALLGQLAAEDDRVRSVTGAPLPGQWCGKQHACWQLAELARHEVLLWMDADVRLEPDALVRMVGRLQDGREALISGFPRQQVGSVGEALLVPLIHVILLGYLPLYRMRAGTDPRFAAGCGQLMMARAEPYRAIGGHGAIRESMHDGITLPRAFRNAGYPTDLFDATDLATCRMYRGLGETWRGLAKNATEGMATPVGLPVWSVLLFGGFVMPWIMLGGWLSGLIGPISGWSAGPILVAAALAMGTSLGFRVWLGHPWSAVVGRPVGIMLLLVIQWQALIGRWIGRPARWKGRVHQPGFEQSQGAKAASSGRTSPG